MGQMTDWPKEAIDSQAMAMLQSLLHEWCAEHGCTQASDIGQEKARELIEWFEFGIKVPDELRSLIRTPAVRRAESRGSSQLLLITNNQQTV